MSYGISPIEMYDKLIDPELDLSVKDNWCLSLPSEGRTTDHAKVLTARRVGVPVREGFVNLDWKELEFIYSAVGMGELFKLAECFDFKIGSESNLRKYEIFLPKQAPNQKLLFPTRVGYQTLSDLLEEKEKLAVVFDDYCKPAAKQLVDPVYS